MSNVELKKESLCMNCHQSSLKLEKKVKAWDSRKRICRAVALFMRFTLLFERDYALYAAQKRMSQEVAADDIFTVANTGSLSLFFFQVSC